MKVNKIFFYKFRDNKINKVIVSKTNMKNCLVTHHSSNIFKLSYSSKVSMNLIERFFPIIADSDNFLELDFDYIRKILSSRGLNIDSELQVFYALDSWLLYDINKRSKYAKQLFSKVRLSHLSTSALNKILDRVLSKYSDCSYIIEAVLNNKQQLSTTTCDITTRYCNQTNFKILFFGGHNFKSYKLVTDVKSFAANNLNKVKKLKQMKEAKRYFKSVCFKGEVYLFGGLNECLKIVKSVEKYSPATNTWKHVIDMMDHFTLVLSWIVFISLVVTLVINLMGTTQQLVLSLIQKPLNLKEYQK